MLDLRLPIGYFFLINAVILIGFGIVEPSTVPLGDAQINLNLCWGLVMGLFGMVMTLLALNERRSAQPPKVNE